MSFKHANDTIDPRDENIVTFNKDKKWFITEYSDLKGAGIEPFMHKRVVDRETVPHIYMWSEKFNMHILYKFCRHIMNGDEVAGDVFGPLFYVISSSVENAAHTASLGTELHIIND